MNEPDEDPNDLAALDAAWEEEEVTFGPAAAAAAQCGKDGLAAKLRAVRRPAPGMPVPEPKRPSSPTRRPTAPEEAPMRDAINHIVFGWYPYLCLTVFLLGSLLRFDREQYTWKTGSSQLLRRRQLMWGSNLFHVGILVIFFGHLVGLLTPIWMFDAVGIAPRLQAADGDRVGGIAGIFCLIGIALLTHRRLFDARIRATSSFGDIAILLILFAQLLLGSRHHPGLAWAISTATRW